MDNLKSKAEHIANVLLIIGENAQGKEDLQNIVYDVLKDNVEDLDSLYKQAQALRRVARWSLAITAFTLLSRFL